MAVRGLVQFLIPFFSCPYFAYEFNAANFPERIYVIPLAFALGSGVDDSRPTVNSPQLAVSEISARIPLIPASWMRSTKNLSSCRHSKLRQLRRIPRVHQRIEAAANERARSTTKYSLFAQTISFVSSRKVVSITAGASATDRLAQASAVPLATATPGFGERDQSRYSASVNEFAANHWPEPLRGDHHNIDIFSRNDVR